MVFPNVGAKSIDEAIGKVAERIPATINNKAGIACGITIKDFEVKCYDLMDTSNNHTPELVERINKAFREKPDTMLEIVRFLAKRDNEETILAKQYSRDACHDYCQYVADNEDLVTILSYCRM